MGADSTNNSLLPLQEKARYSPTSLRAHPAPVSFCRALSHVRGAVAGPRPLSRSCSVNGDPARLNPNGGGGAFQPFWPGNVLIQASVNSSRTAVSSGVGGLRELIQDGVTGLIHTPDDVDDLAAKIVRLADDPALRARLGKAGRVQMLETRHWRRIIEGHFALYDRAKENWGRRRGLWKGAARVAALLPL